MKIRKASLGLLPDILNEAKAVNTVRTNEMIITVNEISLNENSSPLLSTNLAITANIDWFIRSEYTHSGRFAVGGVTKYDIILSNPKIIPDSSAMNKPVTTRARTAPHRFASSK